MWVVSYRSRYTFVVSAVNHVRSPAYMMLFVDLQIFTGRMNHTVIFQCCVFLYRLAVARVFVHFSFLPDCFCNPFGI